MGVVASSDGRLAESAPGSRSSHLICDQASALGSFTGVARAGDCEPNRKRHMRLVIGIL